MRMAFLIAIVVIYALIGVDLAFAEGESSRRLVTLLASTCVLLAAIHYAERFLLWFQALTLFDCQLIGVMATLLCFGVMLPQALLLFVAIVAISGAAIAALVVALFNHTGK